MKKRTDVLSPAQRSYCMSRVKSKNTKIEVIVRSALFKEGFRYRKHVSSLPGSPDIVFSSKRVAVFINGDFWHGRSFSKWRHKMNPYWQEKIENNIKRDRKNFRKLRRMGWEVVRVWEKNAYKDIEKELGRITSVLS